MKFCKSVMKMVLGTAKLKKETDRQAYEAEGGEACLPTYLGVLHHRFDAWCVASFAIYQLYYKIT